MKPAEYLLCAFRREIALNISYHEDPDVTSENTVEPLIQSFEKVYGSKATIVDFDTVSKLEEVRNTVAHISSHDYLYGKWEHFHAVKKAQFPWGNVEVGFDVDENTQAIKNIVIATDSLNTEIADICNDIFHLLDLKL